MDIELTPFWREATYRKPSRPEDGSTSYQLRLARFRDRNCGWDYIKSALILWRSETLKYLEQVEPSHKKYAYLTKLLCVWADLEFHIAPTPIRLIGELIRHQDHAICSSTGIPGSASIGIGDDEAALLRDAIVVWERVYDASEAVYSLPPSDGVDKRRAAYARDHEWLRWREKEELTQPKIRDRWNKMDDFARAEIFPRLPKTIAGGTNGTDVVKKGLKAARNDRKNGK